MQSKGIARAEGGGLPVPPGVATKVATTIALYEVGKKVYDWSRGRYEQANTYTLTVQESDAVYPEVHRWLLDLADDEDHHNLTLLSERRGGDMMVSPDGERVRVPVRLQFNDKKAREVRVGGHKVRVQIRPLQESETAAPQNGQSDGYSFSLREKGIVFTCKSREAQKAVVKHVTALAAKRTERRPRLQVVTQWGHWTSRDDLPARGISRMSAWVSRS